jgi:hypothetical protein
MIAKHGGLPEPLGRPLLDSLSPRIILSAIASGRDVHGCQQVDQHLTCFGIFEIDARRSHAHRVDAAHDEHAIV